MEIYEKIRFIRSFKGWSQEEMAHRLDVSVNAYAKIERGETDINLSRLKQIAEVLEIELSELFNLNEKSVIRLSGSNYLHLNLNGQIHYNSNEFSELKYKLTYLEQENSLLKQQLDDLRDIITLLKR